MLTRKPRKGEIMSYKTHEDDNRNIKYIANGCDEKQPDIMHIIDASTGEHTIIIWRFRDGLNKCLTIDERGA